VSAPHFLHGVVVGVDDIVDSLAGIAEQMGVETALRFAAQFGGTRLYVPSTWRSELPLNLLGEEAARELSRMFGPETIDVPKCPWRAEAVARIAAEMRRAGLTVNEIALALDLSWRTINKALSGRPLLTRGRSRRLDERQIDMDDWLARPPAAE
jgi:hypothetical protein